MAQFVSSTVSRPSMAVAAQCGYGDCTRTPNAALWVSAENRIAGLGDSSHTVACREPCPATGFNDVPARIATSSPVTYVALLACTLPADPPDARLVETVSGRPGCDARLATNEILQVVGGFAAFGGTG